MITPQQLADAFNRNVQLVKMQTNELSHEESVAPLPFRGNCMNWVVGHIIGSRNDILRLLGEAPALDPAAAATYARDAQPLTGLEAAAVPLGQLLAALEESQGRLAAALARASAEDLAREASAYGRSTRTVEEWLFFLYFHETFHVGETSIIRQAAGTDDKVI